eukprot:CAMPEP_0171501282 /NCGR_PEP_ID=MMETSP0958-20121227/9468_1 /TAXON_ID=87120 /ORGANISM="Aurantiochytrium limacinum, Strain ATCCMYA-1381" /LENGTH=358 /DNA_ID=CAMNT_0012036073 /DNA_START=101 /DNA_END=1178 /DNA_ORIENTATION=+
MGQNSSSSKTQGENGEPIETMNAVVMCGLNERKFTSDKPKPIAGKQQVVVQVKAAAVNPVDYKLQKAAIIHANRVMGVDFAGVVVEVGAEVKDFAKGDRVFGTAQGSLAEYAKCSIAEIAKMPEAFSFAECAALPVTFLTAYQSLKEYGYKKGQSLVVIGASGGAGTAAIIMGRAIGGPDAEIIGVCSGKNAEMVKKLGADRVIDYTKETPLRAVGKGNVDFVYDAASYSGGGEDYIKQSKDMITLDGMYVAINGPILAWLKMFTGWEEDQRKMHLADYRGSDLKEIVDLLEKNNQKPVIGKVMEFNEANVETAYKDLQGRRTKGKIILSMDTEATPVTPTENTSSNPEVSTTSIASS